MADENGKRINKNTVYNAIKSISSIIYPLITFPYITRVLLTDNVGKITFGSSIVSYFSLFASLGISTYAIREGAKVRDKKSDIERIASEVYSINLLSTLISYIALFILIVIAKPLQGYRLLICIQSASILFSTIGADWINTIFEDFKYIAIRTVSMQFLALVLMFIFVRHPEDYFLFAVISVVASSGANIANYIYRRKYCRVRFTLHMRIKKHLPAILLLFSLVLSQTIYTNSDITILGLIRGDNEVGLYGTSVKIYQAANMMIASIAWVVMPQITMHFSKKNYDEINRLLAYSLNFIVILGIPIICGIEVIAPELVILFAGKEYVGAALSLRILCGALALSLIGGWIGNLMLIPSGKEKICIVGSLISAITNILLNLIFIPHMGLNAAAATTVISELIGLIVVFANIDKRIHITNIGRIIIGPSIGGIGVVAIGIISRLILQNAEFIAIITILLSIAWYVGALLLVKDPFFMGFLKTFFSKGKKSINNT